MEDHYKNDSCWYYVFDLIMHYSELKNKKKLDAYQFLIVSPESRPLITVFFLLTFPVQTYKFLKGSSESSYYRNKGITDTREGLSTKLFFSDREKLQNRNDKQLLLEILIKAWIRNSRSGQVAAAPIWPAAIAPQGPVPGNILWKGPSCPCMQFNLALYMG